MNRIVARLACVSAGALLCAGHAASWSPAVHAQPAAVFRAMTAAVTVDAFAHHDRKPILGLTRRDFVLRDNGVEQQIDAIGTTDSAHVIVGLDLSGSVDGATLDRLRDAMRAVLVQLTPADRISVFTFADRLRVLSRADVPGPQVERVLEQMEARGSTPLHDAIVLGTALARADSRPSVFLLFTDGQDTASWTTVRRALDALRHGNVVVFPVGAGLPGSVLSLAGTAYFSHQTWLAPTPGDTLRLLQDVADASGGEFLRVGRQDRLVETFSAILARYRQRYLLSYTPAGVKEDDGWHRIDVRLRGRPGTVVAREGYMARSQ